MKRKRLRDDVKRAIKERDEILDQANVAVGKVGAAVQKVDDAQNELLREYEAANGTFREEK